MASTQMANNPKISNWTSWTLHCWPTGTPQLHSFPPEILQSYSAKMYPHCAAVSMIYHVSHNWMYTVSLQIFSITALVSIAYF